MTLDVFSRLIPGDEIISVHTECTFVVESTMCGKRHNERITARCIEPGRSTVKINIYDSAAHHWLLN